MEMRANQNNSGIIRVISLSLQFWLQRDMQRRETSQTSNLSPRTAAQ